MSHYTLREKITGTLLTVLLVVTAVVNIVVDRYSREYIFNDIEKLSHVRVALVLGAAVYDNGSLTPVLMDRAQTAIDVYNAGKADVILVSGDNGQKSHNEVIPVGRYLVVHGVPKDKIFIDYAGFDTYDSMYRARDVFGVQSVIIITQQFHLARAIYIARHLGLDAIGMTANRHQYGSRNSIREFFATLKAFVDVNDHAKPTFLGSIIPIASSTGNLP